MLGGYYYIGERENIDMSGNGEQHFILESEKVDVMKNGWLISLTKVFQKSRICLDVIPTQIKEIYDEFWCIRKCIDVRVEEGLREYDES